jgi:hypothetical protein
VIRRLVADPADVLGAVFGLCLGVAIVCAVCTRWLLANADAVQAAAGVLAHGGGR